MITKLEIKSFKTLENVEVNLGRVNVFIGPNGGGKSNLLEAVGVLSAAADGRVDDQRLLMRGVRPGVPALYKSSFSQKTGTRQSPHIFLGAWDERPGTKNPGYEVTLHNPLKDPAPAWQYKTEKWGDDERGSQGRSPASGKKRHSEEKGTFPLPPGESFAYHSERGVAALELVRLFEADALGILLRAIQKFVIYSPTTSVLRGTAPETQPAHPVGLSGGQLPEALLELIKRRDRDEHVARICDEALSLIDWARDYSAASAMDLPLSPAAAASPKVIRFTDRFMAKSRNVLSGYDASEGALYVLFLAVLAAHPGAPVFFGVDNADHGLNPRLARALFRSFCGWMLDSPTPRQALLTTHNPLVLDGLPLQDERVRLFTVSRTDTGRTSIRRVVMDEKMLRMAQEGWTLSRLWVMGHIGGVSNAF